MWASGVRCVHCGERSEVGEDGLSLGCALEQWGLSFRAVCRERCCNNCVSARLALSLDCFLLTPEV